MEEVDIVIAGGGISGLATALALHRKGMGSVVLERSETLRSSGAGIAILTNGWRALDVLGVASKLRPTAIPLQRVRDVDLVNGKEQQGPVSMGEARNVRRSDLIEAMADELPAGTIRFGREILSINCDTVTSLPVIHLTDGHSIKAKVLIGCDGANSVVADFLGVGPKEVLSSGAVRGFTYYPDGHWLAPEFVRIRKGNVLSGRAPVNDQLVFWFVVSKFPGTMLSRDPELIRQFALESVQGFPDERIEMIRDCDPASLSLTHLRYRPPWHILLGKFRKGSVTVAGDAMHVMGPFIGQGGSAAIEDSVVLARCLARRLDKEGMLVGEIGEALEQYVEERRMRLLRLSSQTYLMSLMLESSSTLVKILVVALFLALFRNPAYHTAYDIGGL